MTGDLMKVQLRDGTQYSLRNIPDSFKTVVIVNGAGKWCERKKYDIQIVHVYRKKISGCLGCEYCHNQNYGV